MGLQPHQQQYLGEGLLAPGVIRLFGREFEGLALSERRPENPDAALGINPTSNNPIVLQREIDRLTGARDAPAAVAAEGAVAAAGPAAEDDQDHIPGDDQPQDGQPRLARIYGFSYLGNYYKLANPPVLRVFGQGFHVRAGLAPENHMDILGVEFKDQDFVRGIRMWAMDQLDVVVRIDVTIGWLRELLLDNDMSPGTNVTGNAAGRADDVGRDSGWVGRDSGWVGRDSGWVGRSRR
jgi:hypothetical protein